MITTKVRDTLLTSYVSYINIYVSQLNTYHNYKKRQYLPRVCVGEWSRVALPRTTTPLHKVLRAQSAKLATTAMGAHKKFLIGRTQLGVAQQKEPGVLLRKRSRLTQEAHIYFFQQAVPLFPITDLARSHQVFPGTRSATGARDNMVECQIAAAFTAILARLVVTQQDVRPRRL